MANNGKDTIYIDIDDEITTIIEKVRGSHEKIVALVLPKRATVLQSIVNMKLLKRTADNEGKNLVLITSEAGLMPLAGAVGLYVAKSLQTKPEIPASLATDDSEEVADEDDAVLDAEPEEITAENSGNKSVGELAGTAAVAGAGARKGDDAIETLQLDDDEAPATNSTEESPVEKPQKSKKEKKNRKLAVPNFERFRLFLVLGIAVLILLIGGIVFAATALPKASVTLLTDTSNVNSSLTFTADTAAQQLNTDPNSLTVPAKTKQVTKTQTQQVPTTGKQNNGQKATGTITVSTQCTKKPSSVPSGVYATSNGLTFITTDTLKFDGFNVDGNGNFVCSGDVPVVAQQGGSNYNLPAGSTFSVYGGYSGTNNSAFTGGTDDIIQIVAQSDIDSATQKIAAIDTSAIKQQLENQLKQAGLFPLVATFSAGTPATSSSSNVGDQATTVTVTQTINYTMFGVKKSDLQTLVDNDVKDKIDPSKQSVLSEGLDKATFHVNSANGGSVQVAMATTATAGPDIKTDAIKKQIAGKKAGQVRDMLKAYPGVSDVKVDMSPFWVTSVPNKPDKVTIIFQKSP